MIKFNKNLDGRKQSDQENGESCAKLSIRLQGITTSPVKIGNDVWIGYGAVITKGVNIDDGCIIGANSVVTSDLPPYSIAVGSPARIIQKRIATCSHPKFQDN